MPVPAPDDGRDPGPPPQAGPSRRRIDTAAIPGWFTSTDQRVFEHVLGRQDDEPPGTLVELGAYLGKSAVVVGEYLRPGEELVVCDLFGDASPDQDNAQENTDSYPTLTRRDFEANYLRVHGRLPTVVQAPTSAILEHVEPGSARFVHVDASHLYERVRDDVESARAMLRPGGVVVCDDYRGPHTPGVAAVVWGSVHSGALRPFCLTPSKMYACADGDPAPHREAVLAWLAGTDELEHEVQRIAGADVVRVWPRPVPANPEPDPVAVVGAKVDAVLTRLDALDRSLERVDRRTRRAVQLARAPRPRPVRRLVRALPARVRAVLPARLRGA